MNHSKYLRPRNNGEPLDWRQAEASQWNESSWGGTPNPNAAWRPPDQRGNFDPRGGFDQRGSLDIGMIQEIRKVQKMGIQELAIEVTRELRYDNNCKPQVIIQDLQTQVSQLEAAVDAKDLQIKGLEYNLKECQTELDNAGLREQWLADEINTLFTRLEASSQPKIPAAVAPVISRDWAALCLPISGERNCGHLDCEQMRKLIQEEKRRTSDSSTFSTGAGFLFSSQLPAKSYDSSSFSSPSNHKFGASSSEPEVFGDRPLLGCLLENYE